MFMFENKNITFIINVEEIGIATKLAIEWGKLNKQELRHIDEEEVNRILNDIRKYNNDVVDCANEGDELAEYISCAMLISSTGDLLCDYNKIKNYGNTPRDSNQVRFCGNNIGEYTGHYKCSPHRNKLDVWFYL